MIRIIEGLTWDDERPVEDLEQIIDEPAVPCACRLQCGEMVGPLDPYWFNEEFGEVVRKGHPLEGVLIPELV